MIIYLGNNLSLHGNTPSSIETLGKLLAARYAIKRVSSKQNQLLRWLDMMHAVVWHRREVTVVLIDTYSTLGFYYALGAAVLCRMLTIPYIPILRGGNLRSRLENMPRISRYLFGGANVLIAPSNYLRDSFMQFRFSNVRYIPNSIEMELYEMKERRSVRARLLWVRSFHQIYNPLMALQVLEKILLDFPSAELCMVGPVRDGSFKDCQDYVRKNGLDSKVTFTGVLPKHKWHELSRDFDIFINTTNIDNTPVSVIEAMALGLPVVSTNVGGVPYLVSDNKTGLLVAPGNTEEMVLKIKRLLNNASEAYNIALCARRYVENFGWEIVKNEWFSLLDAFENPLPEK